MEYDIEKILTMYEDDYNPSSMVPGPRNMADGGQIIGKPGGIVKPGVMYYGKIKKKTVSKEKLKVLNQYSQELFGKNYDKLTKPDDVARAYNTAVNRNRGKGTFEYIPTSETNRSPLPKEQKNKLIKFAKANNIKLDFNKYPRFGVSRSIKNKPGMNPAYQKITDSYKNYDFEIFKKDTLKPKQRNFVIDNFELPKGVKNWDFDNFKFGINATKYRNLQKRIERKLKGPIKYTIAADRGSAKGWMIAAMERAYKNQTTLLEDGSRILKEGVERLTYQPIFKEGTNIIIGFKDNTPSGQGLSYYGLKKNTPEGAASWSKHKDYNKVAKFLDITERVKAEPSKILQKILDDKGITKLMGDKSTLTLNDILSHERYYDKLSTVTKPKLIEKQIVRHHISGVGAGDFARANATKDIQLLTGAVNKKITRFESKLIKDGFLSKADNQELKDLGARIRGADGKIYGGGYINPEKQFAEIEKKALEYAKGDKFNVKTVTSYLERLGCGDKKAAEGGRILMSSGGALSPCAEKGKQKLNTALFKGGGDRSLIQKIISGGGRMALSMLNPKELLRLSNIVGPAALGIMAAYEAGSITDDVLRLGKPLDEALAGNWLTKSFLPYSEEFAKQKNLLQSGQLRGPQKEYALEMMKMENFIKEGKRIEALEDLKMFDNEFDDNFTFTSDKEMNENWANLFGKLLRMKPYVFEQGITGRSLENEAAMNEYIDMQTAKTGEYIPAVKADKIKGRTRQNVDVDEDYDFASKSIWWKPDRLVNRADRPKNITRGPITEKGKMKLDYHIPGYTPYDKAYSPSDEEVLQIYRNIGVVPPTTGYLAPGEGTKFRMNQAMQGGNRSIVGTKFSEGGITELRSKYEYKR